MHVKQHAWEYALCGLTQYKQANFGGDPKASKEAYHKAHRRAKLMHDKQADFRPARKADE
jgi:hypothetical protein